MKAGDFSPAERQTAMVIKALACRESQMRPFPLIIPVYIHRIDCLPAVWTAERPAIGSGHHLINALSASSIQSHCIAADGQMEGWINNERTERQREIDSSLSPFVVCVGGIPPLISMGTFIYLFNNNFELEYQVQNLCKNIKISSYDNTQGFKAESKD